MFDVLELVQLLSTTMLVSVFWLIQVVYYPSFKFISKESFVEFHRQHMRRTAWVAGPLVVTELFASCTLLLMSYFNDINLTGWCLNFISVLILLRFSFYLVSKYHNVLAQGKDLETIDSMIAMSWFRTLFWSLRVVLLLFILALFEH